MTVGELDMLRDRVGELEHLLRFDDVEALMMAFGLRPYEARILAVLLKRQIASKENCFFACYSDQHTSERPDPQIIDVWLCKMRHKLRPFGIEIENQWGYGWLLHQASKDVVRAAIAEAA